MLAEILEENHKIIIFSQFTTLLRLTREKLGFDDSNSVYLDGGSTNRQALVSDFKENNAKNVFFLSLKAGGTGLNLTEASYCFLLDPWWNPAVEDQAIGRLHRMGQKKSVNVYRLISKDSIEEKVLELQKIKSDIVKDVLSDETEGFIRSMSRKDLEFLLH
jgi:SNF2 family DNA or RNA helicase